MRSGRVLSAISTMRAVVAASAVVILSVVLVAGCTNERGGGADGGGAGSSAPGPRLSGPPVTLGFVTMENSALGSFPETRVAAEAAVAHANALGGVNGRPLELKPCATEGSPESSQDCANKLVALKPVAVIGGVDVGAEAAMKIYEQADVPYVSGSPQLNGELNSKNSFSLAGGTVAELLGLAKYLTSPPTSSAPPAGPSAPSSRRPAKSVHALYVDLPGLLTVAIQSSERVLRKRGVTDVALVAEKADAADFAPALSRAASGDPDAIIVVFQAQSCARIVQAASALAVKAPMYLIGACATPAVARAAGSNTDKLYFATGYEPVPAAGGDADVAAFREGVPEQDRTSGSQAAFSAVLAVRSLLADIPEPGPGPLKAALLATRDYPNVMAYPFTCDHKKIVILPSICNTAVRLLRWDGDGFADVAGDWIDGRELATLAN
jgi:branched-chain amino acid transport system substrate-binding protein